MTPARILFLVLCASILGGGYYFSSQGVWGASSSVTSIRTGSGGGGLARVK